MARKVVLVCDWHQAEETPALHTNKWTGRDGKRRSNDLCDPCQLRFDEAWSVIENEATVLPPAVPVPTKAAKKSRHSDSMHAKAWAAGNGFGAISPSGRASQEIMTAWSDAGRPMVLDEL